jgi:hypothetical protein
VCGGGGVRRKNSERAHMQPKTKNRYIDHEKLRFHMRDLTLKRVCDCNAMRMFREIPSSNGGRNTGCLNLGFRSFHIPG